jgi:hypothetical protein
MNMLFGTKLDLNKVPAPGSYEPVPAGTYKVICNEFDVQQKAFGEGAVVKFEIVEGPHAGRKVNDFFILSHSTSDMAQGIGQRRMRAWCEALGVDLNLESAEPLLYKPVLAKIRIEPARIVGEKTYNAQNRVETFFRSSDSAAPAAAKVAAKVERPAVAAVPAPKAAAVAAPAKEAGQMPWKR